MGHVLPSLTSLRFFDAAARHLSFTRAALEMNVTQSAVSRQIRLLEEHIGRPLFQRIKQRLILTESGKAYFISIRGILRQAEAATLQAMAYGNEGGILTIAALPTFGSRWLIPRLGDFTNRYPDIQLNLITKLEPFDFIDSDIDVAIHFGRDVWPGAVCHRLMGETIVPVAAPSLLGGRAALDHPEDLRDFTLLQHTTRPQAWQEWLHESGVKNVDGQAGPRFEQFYMVIQAAIAGLGIAVLPRFLIQEELGGGRLVVVVDLPVTSKYAYYLVHPENKAELKRIAVFRDWLLEKCESE
ncbi:MAG: transcriptional regulator GcvA [Candidatus Aminicenantes bacterium]|nr:transcriptional regulator GcvA [Candidatus Aminicenantes bacterium]